MDSALFSPHAIRHQLDRILSSGGFSRNERLGRFLRFVVEARLEGRDDEIKESLIAVEVFGRRPDYDPKLDSIVRTEAGRLRARLTEFYAHEGREDRVVIEVPKGGYLPVFRSRERAPDKAEPRWVRPVFAGIGLFAAGVLAAVWWTSTGKIAPLRIGVLPIANVGPNDVDDHFADGLTDEIINNLSTIEGLTVRSRTSSFVFKGQDIREAGKRLDVDYLLEGSVVRSTDRVRMDAQLVRVRDDAPVWSGKFDRPLTDVIGIQNEIALGIVNNLRVQLGRGRRRYEASVEAHDLYLRAGELARHNPPGTQLGIALLEQAIEKDPSFAPAYAALATGYAIRSNQFALDHAPDELRRMRAAADKAVQLDPLLAEAHAARAMIYAHDAQWEPAEKSFRRALALNPNRSDTYDDFAMWLLLVLGRHEEAIRQLRLAQRADPLSPLIQYHLASALISAERYDEAAAVCLQVPADFPVGVRNQCVARARMGAGGLHDAADFLAQSGGLDQNPQNRGLLGYLFAKSGRRDEAMKMVAASRYANEQTLIYAGLGDADRMFDALDRMAALGPQRVGLMLNGPELAFARNDPRVRTLREKVGLP
jgi:adenylate cyclase